MLRSGEEPEFTSTPFLNQLNIRSSPSATMLIFNFCPLHICLEPGWLNILVFRAILTLSLDHSEILPLTVTLHFTVASPKNPSFHTTSADVDVNDMLPALSGNSSH